MKNEDRKEENRGFSYTNCVVAYGLEENLLVLLEKVCAELKIKIWYTDCIDDVMFVGSILAIVNPEIITPVMWKYMADFFDLSKDQKRSILLTKNDNSLKASLSADDLLNTPKEITEEYLRELLEKLQSSNIRRRLFWDKMRNRIGLLQHILDEMGGGVWDVEQISGDYDVSVKRVQHMIKHIEVGIYGKMGVGLQKNCPESSDDMCDNICENTDNSEFDL